MTLQLKWHHQFQFAGYYAALEKGFYRDAGLEVEIREGGPNVDAIDDVVTGRADFGVGTSGALIARARGQPVVVLAAVFQHSPAILLVPRRAGVTSVFALQDRLLMDTPGSEDIAAMLKLADVDYARMPRVKHNGDPRDLVSGKADAMVAYSTNEPFVLEQLGVPYLAFSPRASGIDFYSDNLVTSEKQIKTHPERVAAFRAASLKGWQYALSHKEEIVDLILRRYSQAKNREALLFEANQTEVLVQPDLIELGYQNPARWRAIAETYHSLGMLPEASVPGGLVYEPEADGIPFWLKAALAGAAMLGVGRNFGGALDCQAQSPPEFRGCRTTRGRARDSACQCSGGIGPATTRGDVRGPAFGNVPDGAQVRRRRRLQLHRQPGRTDPGCVAQGSDGRPVAALASRPSG